MDCLAGSWAGAAALVLALGAFSGPAAGAEEMEELVWGASLPLTGPFAKAGQLGEKGLTGDEARA